MALLVNTSLHLQPLANTDQSFVLGDLPITVVVLEELQSTELLV